MSLLSPSLTLVLVATTILSNRVEALDWTQFRGPTAQGFVDSKSANLPLHWNSTNNVVWTRAIPGSGWSSPIVKGGRIYLTTAVTDGAEATGGNKPEARNSAGGRLSLRVLCLEEPTGDILWNTGVFVPKPDRVARIHNKNSQASATPIIAGDKLYAHFGHLGTACLDLNGAIVWKNDGLNYPPVHGNGGSPVLAGDVLIFSCDGASKPFIVGLDARSGRELWRTPRITAAKKTFSFSTPIVIETAGRVQVITPGSGVVYSLDPQNGREIWRVRYGEGYSVVPRPVYSAKHNLVYLSSGFDRAVLLAIRPDGQGDVTESHVAWQVTKGAPTTPSPLLVEDDLYIVSDAGIASCLDAKSGEIHWQERVGGNHSASPIASLDRVYFQNEEGTCVVVKAGRTFEKLAENSLGERTLASFAAGPGALYIRSAEHLRKISERNEALPGSRSRE